MPGRRGRDEEGERWRRIASDRRRGASALGEEALTVLAEDLLRARETTAQARRRLRRWARRMGAAQPAMGMFLRWQALLRREADRPIPRPARLGRRARREALQIRRENERLSRTVARGIAHDRRLATFSRSRAVEGGILRASARGWRGAVRCLASDPGGEGRRLARSLRAAGVDARAVPDRAMERTVQWADRILVGADTLRPDGELVHKVGTRTLAAIAARRGKPLTVVAGRSKRLPPWADRRFRIPPLFDRTPPRWIGAYWTERGTRPGSVGRGTRSAR
ncbi:MAG: hypothetical protein QXG65_01465 [Thermoplasmata archaeon]